MNIPWDWLMDWFSFLATGAIALVMFLGVLLCLAIVIGIPIFIIDKIITEMEKKK